MNRWALGARPRTLPASVVPVVVGTAVASATGHAIWWRAGCCLVVALAMQVATNYANDYSDGIRGTDDVRVGPPRLVASRLASPVAVRRAALASFGIACVAGLALVFAAGPWLLVVGAASVAAGWLYTGGPRPYGYYGLGEVFVFVFFGLVATVGTSYVQTLQLRALAWVAAIPVGLLATAMLVINNLRDIPGDTSADKRTLAVELGDTRTRWLYFGCVIGAFVVVLGAVVPLRVGAVLCLAALVLAIDPLRRVYRGDKGRDLIAVLGATGRLQLAFGALLAFGIAIG